MVNRLTSNIDESLVNLMVSSDRTELEQKQALDELDQIFCELRTHIEKRYRQIEYEIKSAYAQYDQDLYELRFRLQQIRDELIMSFTSTESNNDSFGFNIDKYRHLEMLTSQAINQQIYRPTYRIELNDLDRLDQCFNVDCEDKSSPTGTINQSDLSDDKKAIQRSVSFG
jgi:hypothetical protein